RDRDDDRRSAADLAREGNTARVRGAGPAARRLGCVLPGLGAARVDAGDREDLARDLRAARLPCGDPGGRGADRALGRDLAAARDRRGLGAARAVGLPHRRALRQAARKAEAVGMIAIRPATTDADLEAWILVRRAVLPDESAGTVASLRAQESEERVLLLAEWDGRVRGGGRAD